MVPLTIHEIITLGVKASEALSLAAFLDKRLSIGELARECDVCINTMTSVMRAFLASNETRAKLQYLVYFIESTNSELKEKDLPDDIFISAIRGIDIDQLKDLEQAKAWSVDARKEITELNLWRRGVGSRALSRYEEIVKA